MSAVIALLGCVVLGLLYWFPIRRWYRRWGLSDAEVDRSMPGDRGLVSPNYIAGLAVTIDARPDQIWPWLLQMGYHRGGLYSYDWLDRLFGYLDAPSAERVLPEFQNLSVGDVIPVGGTAPGFPVTATDPCRALVLGGDVDGFQWRWQFGLYPLDEDRTRLVSRSRACVRRSLASIVFMLALEPAAFIMTRRMLLGIKRRAEALAAGERGRKEAA